MIYGTPQIVREDDTTDKIGIRTLALSKLWQPSSPWPTGDVLAQEALLAQEGPAIPAVLGGMIFVGKQTRPRGGALRTRWTFEGVEGDGKTVTFKDRNHSFDYRFDPGFAQIDIRLNPKYQALKAQYGGDDSGTEVIWPATVPSNSGSAPGLSGGSGSDDQTNPMFGIQDYLRLEGTYTFRYAAFDFTQSQLDIEKIHTTGQLPGKAPPTSDGRNWLKAPSPYLCKGVVFDITEIYWLSGPGGWPLPIYGNANGAAGNAGGLDGNPFFS